MNGISNDVFDKKEGIPAGYKNIQVIDQNGVLVAFEGISGCGKSESIKMLSEYLNSRGYYPSIIEWNSNKTIRRFVGWLNSRKLLTPGIYSILQWLSFAWDYTRKLKPLLNRKGIVIADRYIYSGLTRDKANGAAGRLGRLLSRKVRQPDILFMFDIEPEICYERMKYRDKELFHPNRRINNNRLLKNKDLYYLKKLRQHYIKLMNDNILSSTNVFTVTSNDINLADLVEYYLLKKTRERTRNAANDEVVHYKKYEPG
ncbi:MAG: deoxynucleoside kinase [Bacillota bacterium]|nr:deoxynucleoside kinase [Bacillota bacterium]